MDPDQYQLAFSDDTEKSPSEASPASGPRPEEPWLRQALEQLARASSRVNDIKALDPQARDRLLGAVAVYARLRHDAYIAARRGRHVSLHGWRSRHHDLATAVALLHSAMLDPVTIPWWEPPSEQPGDS